MNHIFKISTEDAQQMTREKYGRDLTELELESVQKGVEFGLELSWTEVLITAIDEAIDKNFGAPKE